MSAAVGQLAARRPGRSLWSYIWQLLRLSWLISWKSLTRARRGRQIGVLFLALFGVAAVVGVFAFSWFFLSFLHSPRLGVLIDANRFLSGVPAMVLTGAFSLTLVFSFGLLLQGLYLAGDMEFLLSAPIPIRAVFGAKLLQAILPNVLLVCLFSVPLLFGLGAANGYTWLYYPMVILLLLAVMLTGAGLASLLVMGIVRVFPARTVAEVRGAVGGILALVLSQMGNLSGRFRFGPGQTSQALRLLTYLDEGWSPFAWAGRGLMDIGAGSWLSGIGLAFVTLAVSGVIFFLTLRTAERLYFGGWARMQSSSPKKRTARKRGSVTTTSQARAAARVTLIERLIPPAMRAVIVKDSLVLRRDLRHLSQLVSPLILGLIYALMFVGRGGELPGGRGELPEFLNPGFERALFVYGSAAIAVFVGWMLMSRLALMAFSQEGKQYWLLKVAPVSANQLLVAKFIVAYLPTVVLGWIFLLVIALLQRNADALWFGLPVVAFVVAGGTGIYLAFGVTGANLEWATPRQMISTSAGCVSSLVSAGYVGLSAALFILPPVACLLLGLPEALGQLLGLGLGGIVSVICAIVPILLVRARVRQLGEA